MDDKKFTVEIPELQNVFTTDSIQFDYDGDESRVVFLYEKHQTRYGRRSEPIHKTITKYRLNAPKSKVFITEHVDTTEIDLTNDSEER